MVATTQGRGKRRGEVKIRSVEVPCGAGSQPFEERTQWAPQAPGGAHRAGTQALEGAAQAYGAAV